MPRYPLHPVPFMLLILLFFSLPAGAATFTVTNINDSGSGSLRQAVLDANANLAAIHEINFQAGLTGTIILTNGTIEISGQLTITGPGADVLAVSGNKVSRVFTVAGPGPTTIQGLTIKEGRAEQGGGIYSAEGFLTLNHLTFSNNLAMNAANAATSGEGGGLYNKGSTLTVMNSTLSDNTTGGAGGGIHNFNGPLTVSNSTLSGNIAGSNGGGGINSYGSTLTVINSTLSGNVAGDIDGMGGGIRMNYGALTVRNSTLTGNTATRVGGGIYSMNIATVNNSLIVGNTASRAKEVYQAYWAGSFTSGYNLFGQQSLAGVESVTLLETDQILAGLADSAIGPLANNGGPTQTHLLVAGSPAINKGNNSLIPIGVTTDQRGTGFPRILDGTVDIGAVEGTTTGPITYILTVSKSSGGNGTVTSNPAGINCGATCTANFTSGTSVTLTATPDSGYSFSGWSGDCTGPSCTVLMDAAKNVTALFASIPPPAYLLSVTLAGTGTGVVTSAPGGIECGAACRANFSGEVTLTAVPASDSVFAGWSGACTNSSGSCAVTMTAAQNVTATFNPAPPATYSLTVSKAGTGTGAVTSNPVGIDCGATCSANFSGRVTLTTAPASGSVFAGWSGACTNSSGSCTVTMTAAQKVTATFNARFPLTVVKDGLGLGTVNSTPAGIACGPACGTQTALFSGSVTLTAIPVAGSIYVGWTGCNSVNAATRQCTVAMTAALTVKANFASVPPVSRLKNGSFEQYNGRNPGASYRAIPAGSTDLLNWTVSGKGVDLLGTYWSAAHGKLSLDLNNLASGGVAQAFATTTGKVYTVLFNLAGNPDGYNHGADPIPVKRVRVRVAAQQVDMPFDVRGKTVGNMGWQVKALSFTAARNTTLQFTSLTAGMFGPAIDNVQVFEGRYVPLIVTKTGRGREW